MRDASHEHKTWVSILLLHVNKWRKDNGWSRETVVQQIVEAHDRLDGPKVTGIKFDPPTSDTFERWKVNADRVYRWLDDVSKDTNHIPANFIPSVMAALPEDRRQHCINDLIGSLGMAVRVVNVETTDIKPLEMLQTLITENGDAQRAVADLIDGTTPDELQRAKRELTESVEASKKALHLVETLLSQET